MEAALRKVYGTALANDTPWVTTDLPTAELVKVSANTFLAGKSRSSTPSRSYATPEGRRRHACQGQGQRRAHRGPLPQRELCFGGGFLPKAIRAFMARAGELGVSEVQYLLRQLDESNTGPSLARPSSPGDARRLVAAQQRGSTRLHLKPDSDDMRNSPALNVAAALRLRGAQMGRTTPERPAAPARCSPRRTTRTTSRRRAHMPDMVLHLTESAE